MYLFVTFQYNVFALICIADIEAQIREIQSKKKELQSAASEKDQVALGKSGYYDQDIYDGSNNKFDGYVTSIATNDEIEVYLVIMYSEIFIALTNLTINNIISTSFCLFFSLMKVYTTKYSL